MATKPDKSAVEQRIRDFLSGAPKDIEPWARLRASKLSEDEGVALCAAEPQADEQVRPDTDTKTDIGAQSQTPLIVTPSDKPEREPSKRNTKMSAGQIAAIVTVAAVVVFFVIYWVGRPEQQPMDNPHGDMQAMMDKMNEAEARMPASERAHRIAELHSILEKNPDDVKAHLEMGVLTFDQKDTASAKQHWEKVIELDPTEVAAWYNLGFLYQSLEPPEPDKAQEAWDKVVELAPDSDLARVVTMHSQALKDPSTTMRTMDQAPGAPGMMPGKKGEGPDGPNKPGMKSPRDSGEAR